MILVLPDIQKRHHINITIQQPQNVEQLVINPCKEQNTERALMAVDVVRLYIMVKLTIGGNLIVPIIVLLVEVFIL